MIIITFAEGLINFSRILSGSKALPELNELMLLFMSWVVVACGKANLLFCVTDYLLTMTLGWSRQVWMIFPTVVSSSKRFKDGLIPENCSIILI